ncbi:alanine racemase [Spirochaetia bacterium]|nr:alanine racemase [Spirochaetia bacterium]
MRATQTIIHIGNFKNNIRAVLAHTKRDGKPPLLCVPVKADAYGHGAVPLSNAALEAGASYLAVAAVGEGTELRAAGITAPVLLLSQITPEEMPDAVAANLTPFIGDAETAALFAEAVSKHGHGGVSAADLYPVHLKIDTGMGRLGCLPKEAAELAAFIKEQKTIRLCGTATHLAVSDSADENDVAYTNKQIENFRAAVAAIKDAGIDPGIVHAANTGATVARPDAWFDMVRPGILLYGYAPENLPPVACAAGAPLTVQPVMELVTKIVALKKIPKGTSVSYGRTWTAPSDTTVGIIPIGYGDGLPRILSGNFFVVVDGARYPVVGRICMDQCMVDLGAAPRVKRWADVTVFGGSLSHNAATIAKQAGTIPYEITCGINKRVIRVY